MKTCSETSVALSKTSVVWRRESLNIKPRLESYDSSKQLRYSPRSVKFVPVGQTPLTERCSQELLLGVWRIKAMMKSSDEK